MAATPLSSPRAPLLPSASPSVMLPRHYDTAAGPVTVDLRRRLHPADLLLPEGRALGLDDWYRHGRQSREFALVAARPDGPRQRVLGQLELRFDAPRGPAGGGGRDGAAADGAGGARRDWRWLEHEPGPRELGGVRSLAVTAKACALERIPCLVARRPRELLGAALEMSLAPAPRPAAAIGVLRPPATGAEVLARLRAEIAALAGIAWPEAGAAP